MPEDLEVQVDDGDMIGWTNTAQFSPISYNASGDGETYYRPLSNATTPVVGEQYFFQDALVPGVFAIAIVVNSSEYKQCLQGMKNPLEITFDN
jgi:hypothetical protein